MFFGRSFKRNKFHRAIFITISVLIAIGLVIPIAGLFQKQPGGGEAQSGDGAVRQSIQERLSDLEEKAKEDPGNTAVLIELAEAYRYVGKPEQAIKTYEQVLTNDPNNGQALYDVAYIYFASGKYDQAVARLQELIKKDPDNKEAHYLYGYVLGYGKKDYSAGIQELEAYIALAKEGLDVEKARQTIDEWKALQAQK